MTIAAYYVTKKHLKNSKGQELRYSETSIFGNEYPENGTGTITVVGPCEHTRKWFARVELKDDKIIGVK